ncbi:FIST N-terminal domain-containing protein [Cognatishimia sp. F0-27]|uniref:FIST N-terminal domain-containing protein n=1 Tax=Cognatishimia sp. F0-27 TaxID=2816855 RepID=UPI001D0C4D21|nr:FIST N-terminal domain-containing protein [Cognatishimia sp. F0-27]MCC1492637.1 FIST C-terminal domain-containing protein [Cognatishimia sp. F0-27]
MDGTIHRSAGEEARRTQTLRVAQVAADTDHAAQALSDALGDGPFAMVCLFAAPRADFTALTHEALSVFGGAEVLACTTAGEIGAHGYEDDQIIAVGFPSAWFDARVIAVDNLDQIDEQALVDDVVQMRMALTTAAPGMASEFAFLLVDGLSLREEHLTAVLAAGLGPMPLFGGSAGDGTSFRKTRLSHNGHVLDNGAILSLVRSHCPVRVFSLDHLQPTQTRMVVTGAEPEKRVVTEINAEPAAEEYARLLGKDPLQLSPFIFAAHPVVVRLGDTHHVRAIQRVSDSGELIFFSAINEGMVLTLAEHLDIAEHLDQGLTLLGREVAPDHIIGCDCILRRIDAGQAQKTQEISEILKRHNVTGFSTYGEQIGALHVNQTFTGVALYPPASSDPED